MFIDLLSYLNIFIFLFFGIYQLLLSNRYKDDIGNDYLFAVDCVDVEVNEPWPYCKATSGVWYSQKFNEPGVRYEVATSIRCGDICWVQGPVPCGKQNDLQIFKTGLRHCLDENERVEADSGYKALDPEFCKTPSGLTTSKERKKMQSIVRARHETVNKRFKQWAILKFPYRHELKYHGAVFRSIAILTQLAIEKGKKLFEINFYDDDMTL